MNSTRRGTLALLIVIALGCVLYGTGALLGLPQSVQLWHSVALSRYRLDVWSFHYQKLHCSAPCRHSIAVASTGSVPGREESALWAHSWTLMVSHTLLSMESSFLLSWTPTYTACDADGMQADASPGDSQSQLQAAAEAHFASVSDKDAVAAAARTDAQAAEADSTAEAAASAVTAAQADLVDKALASEHTATGKQAGQGRPAAGNTSSGVPNSKPTILSEDTGVRRAAAVNQASKAGRTLRRRSTTAPAAAASTAVVRRRAGHSEPVAAAGSGAAGVAVGMREAARAGLGRLAQRLQTTATRRPAQPVGTLPRAQNPAGARSGRLQRADLVVAMPSAHDRLAHPPASQIESCDACTSAV